MGQTLTACVMGARGGDKRSRERAHMRAWKTRLLRQKRELLTQAARMETSEKRLVPSIRAAHKRNDMVTVRTLAAEIARSQRQRQVLAVGASRCERAATALRTQAVQAQFANAMIDSTAVMRELNRLNSLEATRAIANELHREMSRNDYLQEQLSDALGHGDDDDETDAAAADVLRELTDDEVNAKAEQVLQEILKSMPTPPRSSVASAAALAAAAADDSSAVEIEMADMPLHAPLLPPKSSS